MDGKLELPSFPYHSAPLGQQSGQPYAPAALHPPPQKEIPRYSEDTEMRRVRTGHLKIPRTLLGIERETSSLVAQCLNQQRQRSPHQNL